MRFPVIIAAAIAVGGCEVGSERGSFSEQLGFSAGAPDEFLIIARKPIEMPPSYDLPRPQPGAASRVDLDPLADAHTSLFNRPSPARLASASTGEQVLLSGANAEGDNSVVRQVLAGDDPETTDRRYGMSTLFGVAIPSNFGDPDEIVAPVAETELLRRQGYLTPTAPDGLEDIDQSVGLLTERGVPTEEEIKASIDSGG